MNSTSFDVNDNILDIAQVKTDQRESNSLFVTKFTTPITIDSVQPVNAFFESTNGVLYETAGDISPQVPISSSEDDHLQRFVCTLGCNINEQTIMCKLPLINSLKSIKERI